MSKYSPKEFTPMLCLMHVLRVTFYDFFNGLQRHGKGKLRTATKNLYEGEFQYNHIHGYGTMTYENKDVYVGRWKNGLVCFKIRVLIIHLCIPKL